jgi:ubiquinone/menaquinone biosynthesis C-methylase UbiE
MPVSAESLTAEESRIREAYARRRNDDLYSYFNNAYLFMAQEREKYVLSLLAHEGYVSLDDKKILEIGCGTGRLLREYVKWGARPENITGIELLFDRVCEARHLGPDAMQIDQGSAVELNYPSEHFDMVVQSTVFSSVLDAYMKQQMASEMRRVLKRGGLILWYDYHMNNPSNPDVRGIKRREIYDLFLGCRIELKRITLAPPIARLVAPYSWFLCYVMEQIPLFCTHYIGVVRK